jgi:hypothetical protein
MMTTSSMKKEPPSSEKKRKKHSKASKNYILSKESIKVEPPIKISILKLSPKDSINKPKSYQLENLKFKLAEL